MQRRKFLKTVSVIAASVLVGTKANAAINYNGPLYIFIHANGGWDPTAFCDPKGALDIEIDENNPDNIIQNDTPAMHKHFRNSTIKSSTSGNNIRYPFFENMAPSDFSTARADSANDIFSRFFDTYGDRLMILNGLDMTTNGHTSGTRYMWSGKLNEGFPSLGALVAGIKAPTSPLSFIYAGGYDFTDGVVGATRVGNVDAVKRLALTNNPNPNDIDRKYYSQSVSDKILQARLNRIERLNEKQNLKSVIKDLNLFKQAHSGTNELKILIDNLALPSTFDDTTKVEGLNSNRVYEKAKFALAGYSAGLTVSINIESGGFDTHGSSNDNNQARDISEILEGIDFIYKDAQIRGFADKLVFIVGSEFGRTPGYNNNRGKDHWKINSMMFMGAGITGNRVVGRTSHRHLADNLDPVTLQPQLNPSSDEAKEIIANESTQELQEQKAQELQDRFDAAVKVTPQHVNKALRKLMNIENDSLITQYYPIPADVEDLNLFG